MRRPSDVTVPVAVVVVTHEGAGAMVRRCVESVYAAREQPVAIVVVDNSNGPMVSPSEYGSGVTDVVRTTNRGFGAAANSGAHAVRSVHRSVAIALLNDDIEVDREWLGGLVDALDGDERLGAVQPVLLRHGTDRINSLGVRLDRFGAGSDIGLDEPLESLGSAMPIDMFTGGAVLFRPEFLADLGGFDERYFLYYEDVDLALRGRERGWRYLCETASRVHHLGGATTAGLGDGLVRIQERNRLWCAARFASPGVVCRATWLSIRRLRHQPRSAHLRALAEGCAGMPGALIRRARARRALS